MKELLYIIRKLTLIILIVSGMQACSTDLQEAGDVSVRFFATLPTEPGTRSFGDAGQINTLVVGIFDDRKNEIERNIFTVNGISSDIELTLAKNQTYNIVFWAYDSTQNIYNIDDLSAIRMNGWSDKMTFAQAESADAFYASIENLVVTGDRHHRIEMVRPLVQINVGTTGDALQTSVTVKKVPDTFYPFKDTVSSGTAAYTWNFSDTTDEKLSVDDVEYNYLAMGYVFAPATVTQIAAEISLTNDKQMTKTFELQHIKVKANNRSNIVGRFIIE